MIRRLFWLILGAVLGVAGYRRVTALARAVSPAGAARGLTRFVADVRDGMDLYLQRPPGDYMPRQPGEAASTLESHREREQVPGPEAGRGRYRTDHVKDGD